MPEVIERIIGGTAMNRHDEERFHELAHKVLSEEADPAEQDDLRALIAGDPKLKNEFEQLATESTAARELLMLMEDVEHPQGPIPPVPMAVLKQRLAQAFVERKSSPRDIFDSLRKLHRWANAQIGADREIVMMSLNVLQDALLARSDLPIASRVQLESSRQFILPKAMPARHAMSYGMQQNIEATNRMVEFRSRMVALERRLRESEEMTKQCRHEIQQLIESFDREFSNRDR
jgi:hypothetical protein